MNLEQIEKQIREQEGHALHLGDGVTQRTYGTMLWMFYVMRAELEKLQQRLDLLEGTGDESL